MTFSSVSRLWVPRLPFQFFTRKEYFGFKGFQKFLRRVIYLIIHTRNSFYFFVAIKIFMNYVFFVNFAKTQKFGQSIILTVITVFYIRLKIGSKKKWGAFLVFLRQFWPQNLWKWQKLSSVLILRNAPP